MVISFFRKLMLYAPPEEQPKQDKTREEMNEVRKYSNQITSEPKHFRTKCTTSFQFFFSVWILPCLFMPVFCVVE